MKTSTSQKIGSAIFAIGAVYMLGLGWLYSWRVAPAANHFGSSALPGFLGFIWGLSVPLGAFIVVIGAALLAKVLVAAMFILPALIVWGVVLVVRRI